MPIPVPVTEVAMGIRYEPQWAVSDRKGTVIDRILRAGGTPFGPSVFPRIVTSDDSFVLQNTDTGDNLQVSAGDIILRMETANGLENVPELARRFNRFAVAPLRELAKVKHANRFGILFTLDECSAALSESPVRHFLQHDFDNARSISLRFTRRLGVLEAIAKQRVDDYRNVIYTVGENEDGAVKIAVDYQEYFNPALNDKEWEAPKFERFIGEAITYFNSEFTNWFKKLLHEQAV